MIIWTNGVANPWQTQTSSGIQNVIKTRSTTLDDILDAILACCKALSELIINNQRVILNNSKELKRLRECCEAQEEKSNAILSAIFDLRRELLRGNRDIRR